MLTISLKKKHTSYPEYKDSGVEWLGKIPKGWEVNKVKNIIPLQIGWTPPTGNSEYYEGDNLWVNISDLDQKVINDTENKISDIAVKEARIKLVPTGSLLYSFKLSVGKSAFAGKPLYTNEAIAAFLPNKKSEISFLYYLFSVSLINSANENIYGAKLLNQSIIKNCVIPIPPKNEQSVISHYLDEKTALIEKIIEKKQRLVELLQEKRATIIIKAVTKGLDDTVEFIDSGVEWIGKIPKDWHFEKLKYLAPQRYKKTMKVSNDVKYIGLENIESGSGKVINIYEHQEIESIVNVFEKNDVLFGKLRPYLAKVTAAPFSGVCTGELLVLMAQKDRINPQYLFYRLLSRDFIKLVDDSTYGAKMPRADWEFIGNVYIQYPAIEDQQKIAAYLNGKTALIDNAVQKIQRSIDLLQEFKTSFISHAVTGKVMI